MLEVIGAALLALIVVVAAAVWMLRIQAAQGRRGRKDLLAATAEELGASCSRTGPLSLETLSFARDEIETRLTLNPNPCTHQLRPQTLFTLSGALPAWSTVRVCRRGAPGPGMFSPGRGDVVDVALPGPLAALELRSPDPVAARELLAKEEFATALRDLHELAGLASYELAVDKAGLRFGIEGFLLDSKAILRVDEQLRRFGAPGAKRTTG